MEVFVSNLDPRSTKDKVEEWLAPILQQVDIRVFDLRKRSGKPYANLTLTDPAKAQTLIRMTPYLQNIPRHPHTGKPAAFAVGRNAPDPVLVKVLRKDEKDWNSRDTLPKLRAKPKTQQGQSGLVSHLNVVSIQCGSWTVKRQRTIFVPFFALDAKGTLSKNGRTLILRAQGGARVNGLEIVFDYANIQSIAWSVETGRRHLLLTLDVAPRIYGAQDTDQSPFSMTDLLLLVRGTEGTKYRKSTYPGCDQSISGACFVYHIELQEEVSYRHVESLVSGQVSIRPDQDYAVSKTVMSFTQQVERLDGAMRSRQYPFRLQFQLQALWANATMVPEEVHELISMIDDLDRTGCSYQGLIAALQSLTVQLPPAGPGTSPADTGVRQALILLSQNSHMIQPENDMNDDGVHVHRVVVTPTGTYLFGPDKETPNRVTRQFPGFEDCFIRVSFTDELGDKIHFDSEASNEKILRGRFLSILQQGLVIVGHRFDFLGFSHSSLRSQTCWFMRSFVYQGSIITAQSVIRSLGDFEHIRCPAKCAARIGQAFSDAEKAIVVDPGHVRTIPDVLSGRFNFTDGCGTISFAMLKKLHKALPKRSQATLYQIRYKGAKGMLSLDSTLSGNLLCLRDSMIKFTGSQSDDLEICGANHRPLAFKLNRPLIKILEDLGIAHNVFDTFLQQAIEVLRRSARSARSAVDFMSSSLARNPLGLAPLARTLRQVGIDVVEDQFVREVIRALIEVQLRDLKFRTRIPITQAVTLYGISDETGYLAEGEVYVTFATEVSDQSYLTGRVIVTRSPALHPGDVQVARAVAAPQGSSLRALTNCVVFSQHGSRDLPSMLGGGDLDGDLFNVIYDKDLVPNHCDGPAEYAASEAIDIGRVVRPDDITSFFVDFMESDQLGRIATLHQVYADQEEAGTRSSICLQLAALHSAAVDFSKSGQPVNIREIPKTPICRPDFMAPSASTKVHRGIKKAEEAASAEPNDPDRYRYYESERVLGKLYRSINEDEFFEDLQDDNVSIFSREGMDDVLSSIWNLVVEADLEDDAEGYQDLAQQVKDYYDSMLLDIMAQYAVGKNQFLTEKEVLIGTIIGRSGAISQRQREQSELMKARYKREIQDICSWMRANTYEDPNEYLYLAIACLGLCVTAEQRQRQQQQQQQQRQESNAGSQLRSFAWFAAGICVPKIVASTIDRPTVVEVM